MDACTHANASQHTAWRPVHKYPLRLDGVQGNARGRGTDHAAAATWLHLWGSFSLSRVSQKHKRDTRHSETRHREARHTERLTDTEPTDACIRTLTLLPDTRIRNQQTHRYAPIHTHKARTHTPRVLPWTRVDTDTHRDTPLRIHSIRPGPRPAQHGREKKERKEKK